MCLSLQNQDDNKEFDFALVRLVRGLGGSNLFGRKGFYSTLTSLLILHLETSVEKLLSLMNTQLHPAGSNSKSVRFLLSFFFIVTILVF